MRLKNSLGLRNNCSHEFFSVSNLPGVTCCLHPRISWHLHRRDAAERVAATWKEKSAWKFKARAPGYCCVWCATQPSSNA